MLSCTLELKQKSQSNNVAYQQTLQDKQPPFQKGQKTTNSSIFFFPQNLFSNVKRRVIEQRVHDRHASGILDVSLEKHSIWVQIVIGRRAFEKTSESQNFFLPSPT